VELGNELVCDVVMSRWCGIFQVTYDHGNFFVLDWVELIRYLSVAFNEVRREQRWVSCL
jgi:hypothetical protein